MILHGGLAAVLIWQNSISPVGVNTVTLPIKLEMFHSMSKPAAPEVPDQQIDAAAEARPEPVQPKTPARQEPVVQKKTNIKKHTPKVSKSIPRNKQVPVVATESSASSQEQRADSNTVATTPTISMENFDEIRARYLQQLMNVIAAHKYYPTRARRRKVEGHVKVEFMVRQNGVIENVRLAASSGSKVLDKAALDVLSRAKQFEPFPKELGIKPLEFVVPLDYRLL